MSEDDRLVTVLASSDQVIIALAKSMLEDAGIKYFAKGESLQNLFGIGRIGYNPISGPVQIQVNSEDAEAAGDILQEFKE